MGDDEDLHRPEPRVARAERPVRSASGSAPGDLPDDGASAPGETDFVDEPPGSYLRELRVRPANVFWGVINLVLTLVVGWSRFLGLLTVDSGAWAPAKLVWMLLPASCLILLILTCWQRLACAEAFERDWRYGASAGLAIVALVLWVLLRAWAGVSFES